MYKKNTRIGVPGRLSQSKLLVLAQDMISWLCGFEPHFGLWAGRAEPAWDSLSASLGAPPLLVLSLSLKINKLKKKRKEKQQKYI